MESEEPQRGLRKNTSDSGSWGDFFRSWTFLLSISLLVFLLSGPFIYVFWGDPNVYYDGGFPTGEYRLTVVDRNDRPVEGVKLVQTEPLQETYNGTTRLVGPRLRADEKKVPIEKIGYPFNEVNRSGRTPVSDANGRIVLHHTYHNAWGGSCKRLRLLGIELYDNCGGPPSFPFELRKNGKVLKQFRYPEDVNLSMSDVTEIKFTDVTMDSDSGEKSQRKFQIYEKTFRVSLDR